MKHLIIVLFCILHILSFSQADKYNTTLKVLKSVFPKYTIKSCEAQKLFITEVWEKHAVIPLNNCFSTMLNSDIAAVAFEIYLSDVPEDYFNMIKEKIINDSDIDDNSTYKGTGERLIQVIFFHLKNNIFIAKPEGFPLSEMTWTVQDGMSPTLIEKIKTFETIEGCTNTVLLTIEELKGTKPYMHYIFKIHEDRIMTKSIKTCIESFQEKNNKLWLHHIENCQDVETNGATPENVFRIIFKW